MAVDLPSTCWGWPNYRSAAEFNAVGTAFSKQRPPRPPTGMASDRVGRGCRLTGIAASGNVVVGATAALDSCHTLHRLLELTARRIIVLRIK